MSRYTYRITQALRATEYYAKTDMVYLTFGGFWLVVGQMAAAVTSFLFSIVVAHYVPQDVYGSYRYILSTTAIIAAISPTGLGTTIVRAVANGNDSSLRQGFRRSLAWSMPMLAVFLCVAAYNAFFGAWGLALTMLTAGIATAVINAASLYQAYLAGKKKFYLYTLYWTVANVVTTVAVTVTILLTTDVFYIAATYFVASALINICLYIRITASVPPGAKLDLPRSLPKKEDLHLSILNFLNTVTGQADKIIVFHLLGAAQLAVYTFALALPEQVRAVLKSGARLALPKFAERPFEEIRGSLGDRLLRFGALVILLTLCYIVLAPTIFSTLFPRYMQSVLFSQLFATTLFTALGSLPLTALQAHAKLRALYTHSIITNVMQICSSVLLIYFFGLWGAAVSVLFNRVIGLIIPLYLLRKA